MFHWNRLFYFGKDQPRIGSCPTEAGKDQPRVGSWYLMLNTANAYELVCHV